MSDGAGSFAVNRRPAEHMTTVAVRLDSRPAATTQRNRRTTSWNGSACRIDDVHVAPHNQWTTRGDRDSRGIPTIDVVRTGLWSGHCPIVLDGGR